MKKYKLVSEKNPQLNAYGTAREIWEHVQKMGYKGKTVLKDGYQLPWGKGITLEADHVRKQNSVRMSHKMWNILDELTEENEIINNRVSALEYVLEVFDNLRSFRKVSVKTKGETIEFDSLIDVVQRRQFFLDEGIESIQIHLEEGKSK